MADDRDGYLDAFGVPVQVKGQPLVGILDEDYEGVELGARPGIDSRAPFLLLKTPDVSDVSLARGDAVTVWDTETSTWTDYQASRLEPMTDGFTRVRLIVGAL